MALVAGEAEVVVQCGRVAERQRVEEAVVGRRVAVRRRLTADSGDVRNPGAAPLPAPPPRTDGGAALACHRLTGSMTTWCRQRGDAVAGWMTV